MDHDVRTLTKEQIIEANNELAFDLYSEFRTDKNTVFSPASILFCVGMALAGARGETEEEIAKAFFDGNIDVHKILSEIRRAQLSRSGVTLDIANLLWKLDSFDIKEEYRAVLEKCYQAEVLSGSSTAKINEWCSQKTRGMIKQIVNRAPDPMTLLNAIYFKGTWATQFKKNLTTKMPFYRHSGEEISVMTMVMKGEEFSGVFVDMDRVVGQVQAVELWYKGDDVSMILVSPENSYSSKLDDIEMCLDRESFNSILNSLERSGTQKANLYLPKFRIEEKLDLNTMLMKLGIEHMFDSVVANFSGISENPVFVDEVVHKAVIDVNEEGTEAAAVTAMLFASCSVSMQPREFRFDHPFLFFIVDKQMDSILFMGKYTG